VNAANKKRHSLVAIGANQSIPVGCTNRRKWKQVPAACVHVAPTETLDLSVAAWSVAAVQSAEVPGLIHQIGAGVMQDISCHLRGQKQRVPCPDVWGGAEPKENCHVNDSSGNLPRLALGLLTNDCSMLTMKADLLRSDVV
jgi:hypothetical protein